MEKSSKYCFDTSVFIEGWVRHYRPSSFPHIWENIAQLLEKKVIVMPREVYRELRPDNPKDDLSVWIRKFKTAVIEPDVDQLQVAGEIANKYPASTSYNKRKSILADHYVVALAHKYKLKVVTYELGKGSVTKPHIPDLCSEYDVGLKTFSDFIAEQSWVFTNKNP